MDEEQYAWMPQYYDGHSPLEDLDEEGIRNLIDEYRRADAVHISVLCRPCQNICQVICDKMAETSEGYHRCWNFIPWQEIAELEQSAASRCKSCALCSLLVKHHFCETSPEEGKIPSHNLDIIKTGKCHGIASFDPFRNGRNSVGISWRPRYSPCNSIQIRALERYERQRRSAKVNLDVDSTCSTNKCTGFKTAAFWLEDCVSHHTVCSRRLHRNSKIPTRLIDLGPGQLCQPRLCVGATLPADTHYMTLSHCWGKVEFMKTIRTNMEAFQEHIPLDHLTKTFRDAMEITKRLNVRYLWIDSFCIIQDSPEDWRLESTQMAEVYGNSFCNIAATSATDGRAGCFYERMFTYNDERRIEIDVRSNQQLVINTDDEYSSSINAIKQSVRESPLTTRAWVIQELILAPRTLHFTKDQMIFECSQISASESYSDGHIAVGNSYEHLTGLSSPHEICKIELPQSMPLSPLSEPSTSSNEARFLQRWTHIVEVYSKAQLSFAQKDKLVAVRGLASSLCDLEHYACGLWKFRLQAQLFWDLPRNSSGRRRDRLEIPSWSWASVDGEVNPKGLDYYPGNRDPYDVCHVREVSQGYTKEDGTVQGAYLQAEIGLFCARFSPLQGTESISQAFQDPSSPLQGTESTSQAFHDSLSSPTSRAHLHRISCRQQQPTLQASEGVKGSCSCSFLMNGVEVSISLDGSKQHGTDKLYCAIFTEITTTAVPGLLLSPTGAKGCWMRVGVFHLKAPPFPVYDPSRLEKAITPLCKETETYITSQPELYEDFVPSTEEHPRARYMVKIV